MNGKGGRQGIKTHKGPVRLQEKGQRDFRGRSREKGGGEMEKKTKVKRPAPPHVKKGVTEKNNLEEEEGQSSQRSRKKNRARPSPRFSSCFYRPAPEKGERRVYKAERKTRVRGGGLPGNRCGAPSRHNNQVKESNRGGREAQGRRGKSLKKPSLEGDQGRTPKGRIGGISHPTHQKTGFTKSRKKKVENLGDRGVVLSSKAQKKTPPP